MRVTVAACLCACVYAGVCDWERWDEMRAGSCSGPEFKEMGGLERWARWSLVLWVGCVNVWEERVKTERWCKCLQRRGEGEDSTPPSARMKSSGVLHIWRHNLGVTIHYTSSCQRHFYQDGYIQNKSVISVPGSVSVTKAAPVPEYFSQLGSQVRSWDCFKSARKKDHLFKESPVEIQTAPSMFTPQVKAECNREWEGESAAFYN